MEVPFAEEGSEEKAPTGLGAGADPEKEGVAAEGDRKWRWTRELASELQETVNLVFGSDGEDLLGLEFSFTIADPLLEGCPLVGCSSGFGELCGYTMDEIVGRNCKFLVDPVPKEDHDPFMRKHAREFCQAVARGVDYKVPVDEWEPWMPTGRSAGELWCVQRNARKNGELFNNMFYLKAISIGGDIDGDRPYIVGLQSELPGGKAQLGELLGHIATLDKNMSEVESSFAQRFFLSSSMHRQDFDQDDYAFSDVAGF